MEKALPLTPTLIPGGIATDDRGSLRFVNTLNLQDFGIKRFYQVENHSRGFIRAWHGHKKEGKLVYVPRGAAKIAVIPMDHTQEKRAITWVLSDDKPQVLYIPPGYYNGNKTLRDDTIILFFSTMSVGESEEGDDFREPVSFYTDCWLEAGR